MARLRQGKGRYKEVQGRPQDVWHTARQLALSLLKCARVHRGAAQGAAAVQKNRGRIGHRSTEYIYVLGLLGDKVWAASWPYGLG